MQGCKFTPFAPLLHIPTCWYFSPLCGDSRHEETSHFAATKKGQPQQAVPSADGETRTHTSVNCSLPPQSSVSTIPPHPQTQSQKCEPQGGNSANRDCEYTAFPRISKIFASIFSFSCLCDTHSLLLSSSPDLWIVCAAFSPFPNRHRTVALT